MLNSFIFILLGGGMTKENIHYKSIFTNEQELLNAILILHNNSNDIELDPMFNKGSFYKDIINTPKYRFDINAIKNNYDCEYGNACNLPFKDNSIKSMILDPPFMFGIHGKTLENKCAKRYTMYEDQCALISSYNSLLDEASRILMKDGLLIFKCQDYTDKKTFMTHCLVYNLAVSKGFYAKDLVLLNKENKIYNSNLKQRHFRKTHCYFWIFVKQ